MISKVFRYIRHQWWNECSFVTFFQRFFIQLSCLVLPPSGLDSFRVHSPRGSVSPFVPVSTLHSSYWSNTLFITLYLPCHSCFTPPPSAFTFPSVSGLRFLTHSLVESNVYLFLHVSCVLHVTILVLSGSVWTGLTSGISVFNRYGTKFPQT